MTPHRRLMAVEYSVRGRNFIPGTPRQWTPIGFADTGVLPNYDLFGDGYIVALVPAQRDEAQATHVTMITGFPEELRRKVP